MAIVVPEDVRELMYKTWLPSMMTTVLECVKELPAKQRKVILTKVCDACGDLAMAGVLGIQPGMSWEQYVKYLKQTVPPVGPWTIKRKGDVFDLIYDAGEVTCHCPLLLLGIIQEQFPECCASGSGARLGALMIEAATKRKVSKTVVIDCPTKTGSSICHYRVWLKKI